MTALVFATTVFVYAFTYERDRTDEAAHAYGVNKMDPGGGFTQLLPNINQHHLPPLGGGYDPPEQRRGTIGIEVIAAESDGGIVLRVTESPAKPATCVAYADTTIVCDPSAPISAEALALASLLGKGFVEPSRDDSSGHWHAEAQGANANAVDYRIVGTDGAIARIEAHGTCGTDGREPTLFDAKIEYDTARAVPVRVDESTVRRRQLGAIFETVATHLTFELQP